MNRRKFTGAIISAAGLLAIIPGKLLAGVIKPQVKPVLEDKTSGITLRMIRAWSIDSDGMNMVNRLDVIQGQNVLMPNGVDYCNKVYYPDAQNVTVQMLESCMRRLDKKFHPSRRWLEYLVHDLQVNPSPHKHLTWKDDPIVTFTGKGYDITQDVCRIYKDGKVVDTVSA